MKVNIGGTTLFLFGGACLACCWFAMVSAFQASWYIPRYAAIILMLLLFAEGLIVILRPKAFFVPFVLFAFALITLFSSNLQGSVTISLSGFECGWPMQWLDLTVSRQRGMDNVMTQKLMNSSTSIFPMLIDVAVTVVLSAPLLVIDRFIKRIPAAFPTRP